MFRWKTYAAGALLSIAASPAFAANPFADVPRTHWAYEAIQKAVDAGVLQGFDGKFMGEKTVNRYQMAVVVKRLLEVAGSGTGKAGSGVDVKNLEQLSIEFADELALLNTKVQTLEDSFVALRGEVDKLKGGSGASSAGGLTNAFTGFVSVGLVNTDDATGAAGSGGARTRYTAASPDQLFFTIPQASIALDKEVGEGIGLHVQYDYGTNALGAGVGATLDGNGLGTAVGLNEAYLLVDEIFGDIGAKIGGFALPFQSWEVNGPFRTCNMTVTPSAQGTFFEGIRVVGLEVSKMKDVDPADFQWRLGIFNGNDIGAGNPGAFFGGTSDVVGLAALQGSATFDDSFGFYIDLESGNDPDRNWGWRFGYFDIGGDNGNVPPGPPASTEADGWEAGFWWKKNDFKVILQYLDMQADGASTAGAETDADDLYLIVNYQINDQNNVSLRYDGWSNENDVTGNLSEGSTWTFGFNRKTSDTSMLQFEWQGVDEEINNGPGAPQPDFDDDLIQIRYKVWF